MPTLPHFRHIHAGASIVVCGCGSSLSVLTEPGRFITIGVNDVGRLFQPDYLVVVNPREQFAAGRFVHVEQSRARALFTQLDLRVNHRNVVRFGLGRRGGTDFSDPNVLHYTRNSPYVAACLAVHMGAKRIGIIGVDFTNGHFFGRTGTHPLQKELRRIDEEYGRFREACRAAGVEVYNLSAASRLTTLPKISVDAFAALGGETPLRIVSYATTPVAGVPPILSRAIAACTPHQARCVWATNRYGSGVAFDGDVEYRARPAEARALLEAADVVIVHNGKVDAAHRALIDAKAVVTLAHNYAWNVDTTFVDRGKPGLVVGQYQATLPELAGWTAVPNPIPLWEHDHQPGEKSDVVTISFTPSGRHETYPPGHRLYWHSKGYTTTMRALERLSERFALQLEVVRGPQVTHAEALAMKRRAHIVIDECATGSYHRNSLEGLAAGCVVVNGMGILPAIVDVFRACAPGAHEVPFVSATLADLEQVLERLIEQGAGELAAIGARNRRWMEEHWRFDRQWSHFWRPVIERATERPRVIARPIVQPAADPLADLTIVIPFGGEERLRNLRAVTGALRAAAMPSVIVVESDTEPKARSLVEEAGFRYEFLPTQLFHKAKVMNAGAALVSTPLLAWLDADLLTSRQLFERAVEEMRQRRLDCLVPWTSVDYLSADDSDAVAAGVRRPESCTPRLQHFTRRGCCGGIVLVRADWVRQFGGMCKEFIGWGGEDNAFFVKATLLGRAAVTCRNDQRTHHLYHRDSGYEAAMPGNPHYQRNVALLREMRSLRTKEAFLRRFPPPSVADAPFDVVILSANASNLIACVRSVLAHEPALDPSRIIVVDDSARAGAEASLPGVLWVEGVKPFVFARNANRGIAASSRDVILLNDDAELTTAGGFDALSRAAHSNPNLGIVSAAIRGVVGNANQVQRKGNALRAEGRMVCFIAAYLRRDTIDRVGLLDEQFIGYGFDDDDYCERARQAGFSIAVYDGCVVEHGRLPSTYRARPDHAARFAQNRALFADKTEGQRLQVCPSRE